MRVSVQNARRGEIYACFISNKLCMAGSLMTHWSSKALKCLDQRLQQLSANAASLWLVQRLLTNALRSDTAEASLSNVLG